MEKQMVWKKTNYDDDAGDNVNDDNDDDNDSDDDDNVNADDDDNDDDARWLGIFCSLA